MGEPFFDVEMDCVTVTDGELDECLQLPGKQIEMSIKLSKVTRFQFDANEYSVIPLDANPLPLDQSA